ncbi:hypothetical protein [Wolbachia endosymbiont of Diaphorina citri]|nr:hypothetical protein [Wolbachia endosymbiont of Diaphorina citri]
MVKCCFGLIKKDRVEDRAEDRAEEAPKPLSLPEAPSPPLSSPQ